MYHISNDIRAQESARRISEALMDCAKHRPFSDITISSLKDEYGISRTTFYRLFDNTVDVLEYMVDRMSTEDLMKVEGNNLKKMTINTMYALRNHRDLIQLLSKSGNIHMLQQKQQKYLSLSKFASSLNLDDGAEYFYAILTLLIPTTLEVWAHNGMRETPEEVYRKLRSSLGVLGLWFSVN
ncbi:MAG: TetR/AcrR family transcriptional regulator [Fusicatenibacter sp.]|nr:TetR/AcrR family transcriptional regulator [Fusicatenibacter sp.]